MNASCPRDFESSRSPGLRVTSSWRLEGLRNLHLAGLAAHRAPGTTLPLDPRTTLALISSFPDES